jgi:hypothetical protein
MLQGTQDSTVLVHDDRLAFGRRRMPVTRGKERLAHLLLTDMR